MKQKPIAYEAYQQLAEHYAAHIDTKPHNAYYDRPAMLGLLPDVDGLAVLDAGCGPGAYTVELLKRGASVIACDVSEKMIELANERVAASGFDGKVQFNLLDLTQSLTAFSDEQFDVVNAPLCLDYIEDWGILFAEFFRILKDQGVFVFSCGHPSFDVEYYKTAKYFEVEQVECVWTGFGKHVTMPSYRRPLERVINPVIESGFVLEKFVEPRPTEQFKAADPVRYEKLLRRPNFCCVRARKISAMPG